MERAGCAGQAAECGIEIKGFALEFPQRQLSGDEGQMFFFRVGISLLLCGETGAEFITGRLAEKCIALKERFPMRADGGVHVMRVFFLRWVGQHAADAGEEKAHVMTAWGLRDFPSPASTERASSSAH